MKKFILLILIIIQLDAKTYLTLKNEFAASNISTNQESENTINYNSYRYSFTPIFKYTSKYFELYSKTNFFKYYKERENTYTIRTLVPYEEYIINLESLYISIPITKRLKFSIGQIGLNGGEFSTYNSYIKDYSNGLSTLTYTSVLSIFSIMDLSESGYDLKWKTGFGYSLSNEFVSDNVSKTSQGSKGVFNIITYKKGNNNIEIDSYFVKSITEVPDIKDIIEIGDSALFGLGYSHSTAYGTFWNILSLSYSNIDMSGFSDYYVRSTGIDKDLLKNYGIDIDKHTEGGFSYDIGYRFDFDYQKLEYYIAPEYYYVSEYFTSFNNGNEYENSYGFYPSRGHNYILNSGIMMYNDLYLDIKYTYSDNKYVKNKLNPLVDTPVFTDSDKSKITQKIFLSIKWYFSDINK